MAPRPGLGSEIFSFEIDDLAKNTDFEHTNKCMICRRVQIQRSKNMCSKMAKQERENYSQ